jgi:hypothetical protein
VCPLRVDECLSECAAGKQRARGTAATRASESSALPQVRSDPMSFVRRSQRPRLPLPLLSLGVCPSSFFPVLFCLCSCPARQNSNRGSPTGKPKRTPTALMHTDGSYCIWLHFGRHIRIFPRDCSASGLPNWRLHDYTARASVRSLGCFGARRAMGEKHTERTVGEGGAGRTKRRKGREAL